MIGRGVLGKVVGMCEEAENGDAVVWEKVGGVFEVAVVGFKN